MNSTAPNSKELNAFLFKALTQNQICIFPENSRVPRDLYPHEISALKKALTTPDPLPVPLPNPVAILPESHIEMSRALKRAADDLHNACTKFSNRGPVSRQASGA